MHAYSFSAHFIWRSSDKMWKFIAIVAVFCLNSYATPSVYHRPLEFDSSDPEVIDFEKGLEVVEESFYEGISKNRIN